MTSRFIASLLLANAANHSSRAPGEVTMVVEVRGISMTKAYDRLLDRLRQRLGPAGMLTDPADTDPYCQDWRRLYHGRTPAVLRPANTTEVADAVRLLPACAPAAIPPAG